MKRPDCIKHFEEIQTDDNCHYPQSDELLCFGSALGKAVGLKKIGIHHENLPPGRRTSWPHCESDEEEFAFVIEGNPHVWIDGYLHALKPGDSVGFPAGTGISHTFINNTETNVRLLVVGEASKTTNKIFYPLNPERKDQVGNGWWSDVPRQNLGPHDGLPDKLRNKNLKR